MPSPALRLTIAACCLLAAAPAAAITVTKVEVSGLDDERMAQNVRVSPQVAGLTVPVPRGVQVVNAETPNMYRFWSGGSGLQRSLNRLWSRPVYCEVLHAFMPCAYTPASQ